MKREPTTVEKYLGFAAMIVGITLVIDGYYSRQLLKEQMENSQRINQQFQKIMELQKEIQELLKENRELHQRRQQKEKEDEQMEECGQCGLEIKNTDIQLRPGKAESGTAK